MKAAMPTPEKMIIAMPAIQISGCGDLLAAICVSIRVSSIG
jgi:hypothetical protein